MPKPKPDQAELTLLNSIIAILNEDGISAAIEIDLHTREFYILAKTRPTSTQATAIILHPTKLYLRERIFIKDTITLTPEDLADPEVFKRLTTRVRAK